MSCDKTRMLIVDSLMGEMSTADRETLNEHLASCPSCAAEAGEMESTWRDLGQTEVMLSDGDSTRMVRRFQQALEQYQSQLEIESKPDLGRWWVDLWSTRPLLQAGFSAAVLACGIALGLSISDRDATRAEVEALRADLDSMNRAVTVLLQHESATERLRAVNWSKTDEPTDVVLDALLQSARLDPNVNVRLAAVDALAEHAGRAPIRSSLIDSLAVERSPLVQLAVLEVVAGDRGFRTGELERILQSSDLDPSVLEHFSVRAERL